MTFLLSVSSQGLPYSIASPTTALCMGAKADEKCKPGELVPGQVGLVLF